MEEQNNNNVVDFSSLQPEAKTEAPAIDLQKINEETLAVSPALIINALKCIDAGAQRGAFSGGELSAVGNVRDHLYMKVGKYIEAFQANSKQNKG